MEAVRNPIRARIGDDNPGSGKRNGAEYRSWVMMKQRCQNPNATGYFRYGGRGITVCDRWQSFDSFAADMGPRPAGTSLDRIDNGGNYTPRNCRWATKSIQQQNRRTAGKDAISIDGQLRSVQYWSRRFKVFPSTLRLISGINRKTTRRRLLKVLLLREKTGFYARDFSKHSELRETGERR